MSEKVKLELGKRIRELREERDLSLRTFALMVSLDRSYIIGIEHGRRNVSIDNIVKIAEGLDVSLEELFQGIGEASS